MSQRTSSPPISADITDHSWKPWFQAVYRVIKTMWTETVGQYLGIGDFNQSNIYPLATLHVRSPDNTADSDDGIIIERDSDTNTPTLRFRRSRGLNTTRTDVQPGDLIGSIKFQGYYSAGSSWPTGAEITTVTSASPTSSFGINSFLISKTSDGNTSPKVYMTLSGKGDFGFGENTYATDPNTNYTQTLFGLAGGLLWPHDFLGSSDIHIASNCMFQGNAWKYTKTGAVGIIRISNDTTSFVQDVSGTAGTGITSGFAVPPSLEISRTKGISIGCTPLATVGSNYAPLWIGSNAVILGEKAASTTGSLSVAQNAYYDGTNWKYINSAPASLNYQFASTFYFYTAASGIANNNISWNNVVQISASGAQVNTSGGIFNLDLSDTTGKPGIKFNNGGGNNVSFLRQSATALEVIDSAYAAVIIRSSTNAFGTYANMGIGPGSDNAYLCGKTGFRWSQVWAANGVIQTSDVRLKKDITDSSIGLEFIEKLRPVSYKWIIGKNEITPIPPQKDKDGKDILSTDNHKITPVPGKRIHYGLIAQEVKKVIDDAGLEDFAGWVQDDLNDPNSTQSLNYQEFIAPMIKAIQELSTRIKVLEANQK